MKKKIEEALRRVERGSCECCRASCRDAQVLARAMRSALKDRERLTWLRENYPLFVEGYDWNDTGVVKLSAIDAAIRASRKEAR